MLPAKDRRGKTAWLGPLALVLGLASWFVPVGDGLAAIAVICGIGSIMTRGAHRVDWTAAVGFAAGAIQLYVALLLALLATVEI